MHYEHPHNNPVTFYHKFSTRKNTNMCCIAKVKHIKLFCHHICFKKRNIRRT